MFIRRNVIMATSKDIKKETVETAEVKETAKKAPAKKAAAKKTETTKTEEKATKTTAKKATTKKTTTKKAETADKAEATKAPAKKPAAKKPAMKVNMHIQFAYKDYESETIYEMAINDYVAAGNKKSSIKTLVAYVKAEDNKVYYVINDEFKGEVGL